MTADTEILARRDSGLLSRVLPLARWVTAYFRPEVRGLENIPASGPCLVVGAHSGGIFMPDAIALVSAWLRREGPQAELFCLAYDLLFAVPGLSDLIERFGVVPASPPVAEAALRRGAVVLVYPGGDLEDCRPWRERHHIDLGGHTGFVRLALRTGVPVVPVVAHGSQEAELILTSGRRIARVLGLRRLRVHVFPIVFGLPFGLVPIFVPHLPLPAHVTVEVLPALQWSDRADVAAAEDGDTVERCYREIVATLQSALNRLASESALPILDPPPRVAS